MQHSLLVSNHCDIKGKFIVNYLHLSFPKGLIKYFVCFHDCVVYYEKKIVCTIYAYFMFSVMYAQGFIPSPAYGK